MRALPSPRPGATDATTHRPLNADSSAAVARALPPRPRAVDASAPGARAPSPRSKLPMRLLHRPPNAGRRLAAPPRLTNSNRKFPLPRASRRFRHQCAPPALPTPPTPRYPATRPSSNRNPPTKLPSCTHNTLSHLTQNHTQPKLVSKRSLTTTTRCPSSKTTIYSSMLQNGPHTT